MSVPVVVLLVITFGLLPLKGLILYAVFRQEITDWWQRRRRAAQPGEPTCMYCGSRWTVITEEGRTRWEGDELVLVTAYECQHCHLPFWNVQRVPLSSLTR